MRYYHIRGRNARSAAVVRAPADLVDLVLWADLETRRAAAGWVPPTAAVETGVPADWPPSDLLPRLCSEKLKRVLEGFSDRLVWLPVRVLTPAGTVPYFILHFGDFDAAVDPDKSKFVAGRLVTPHLSLERIAGRRVFAIQPLSPAAIVDDDVKRAVVGAGCTGIDFEHCPAS